MPTKNLYILTSNFPPTNIVGALRPYRIAKHIGQNGWKPIIVTFSPSKYAIENDALLKELHPDTEICHVNASSSNTSYVRVAELSVLLDKHKSQLENFPTNTNKIFVKKIIHALTNELKKLVYIDDNVPWIRSIVRAVESRLNVNETNVILTTSPPHSMHVAGLILKNRYKQPWMVDFRDPWDSYPKTGNYEPEHWLSRLIEPRVIANADSIISTTYTNTKVLCSRYGKYNRDRFSTVTNTYDEKLVNIESIKDLDKFVISYTGIFYANKDPYTFFRALRSWFDNMSEDEMRSHGKRLKVQLIGYIDNTTKNIIKELDLTDTVVFKHQVSHPQSIQYLKNSDLALIAGGIGKKSRPGWLPSKLTEYLGSRIPILAVIREGEMAEILRATNSGYVITTEDHKAISDILYKEISNKFYNDKIKNDYHTFTFDGVEQFEEEKVFNKIFEIIQNISQG